MRGWMIAAAVVAGAAWTVPAGAQAPSTRPAADPLADRPVGALPTTRPVAASPSTQPAAEFSGPLAYMGSTVLSDNARIEVVGDKLVIAGSASDLSLIRALVEAMEQTGPAQDIKLFSLKNAQAQAIAPTLQRLWSELQRGQPDTPENRVSILSDSLSNTIIIGGTAANIERLGRLIEGIENSPSIAGQIKDWTPIKLKHMRASEAADIVRQTLEKLQKQKGVTGPSPIDVQVDARQNSLLIVAPQKDIEQVHKLIEIIDKEPETEFGIGTAKLAVFPLLKGKADTIRKTLEEMIKLEAQKSDTIREQIRRLRLAVKAGPDGKMEDLPDLDLEKPIKIIADEGMNAVIVGTTDKNIKPLAAIINLLDTVPTSEEMVIRIFALKNADAVKRLPEGPEGSAMVFNV